MKPTNRPRVKICCISSLEEAELAIECGASALGLVSDMPSGPGVIDEELISRIAVRIPPPVATFLLTSKQDCDAVIRQQRGCRTTCIQICDRLTSGDHRHLKQALPGISIVQVIHVVGRKSIDEAIAVSDKVDAILLDSGNQSLAIRELGGTGRVHDWAISREIRERASVPIFLAGDLNANNVRLLTRSDRLRSMFVPAYVPMASWMNSNCDPSLLRSQLVLANRYQLGQTPNDRTAKGTHRLAIQYFSLVSSGWIFARPVGLQVDTICAASINSATWSRFGNLYD
jgi:phosphoribosylanthranilate isomerase